jgi:serine/threonine-protein kinase CHEK2
VLLDKARFVFRYPKAIRENNTFLQKYTILQTISKGHSSEVFSCVEKSTAQGYAVKVFTKDPGESTDLSSKIDSLQQEIAIFMSINHPNILYCHAKTPVKLQPVVR